MPAYHWNTWEVAHTNALVHLPTGLRVCFKLSDPAAGTVKESFDWQNDLVRLGPHAPDGSYLHITLRWAGVQFSLEAAHQEDVLVCRLRPAQPAPNLRVEAALDRAWGGEIAVERGGRQLSARLEGTNWLLCLLEPLAPDADAAGLSAALDQTLLFCAAPTQTAAHITRDDALDLLRARRTAYGLERLKTGGWLEDAADGITRALHWNTIWEPLKGRVCTPVSREWCVNPAWGGYVLFDWDTFFAALMAGLEDPALAAANLRAIAAEVTPDGFVPNFGAARQTSLDRSQPPVGAYCLLRAYRASRLRPGTPGQDSAGEADFALNRPLLGELFPKLLTWHRWWLPHRDGNGDGLLEWGSDPKPYSTGWEVHTLRAAMFESGLDNSPMYDETEFNPAANTMELADVGLNALYALDAWALSEIARELGLAGQAEQLAAEYRQVGDLINRQLWNEEAGIYQNRHWDGRFSEHLSPTLFYPLLAGIVPAERARRMVSEHLTNEAEFWGPFVIPSIARSDPGYHQNERVRAGVAQPMSDYWRGRIWGPMNFLVSAGLRRAGFEREADAFARRSLALFLQEWQAESHVHENYHDITGEGDDVPSSNALYHWGALLAYIAVQELAGMDDDGLWHFGSLGDSPAAVDGIRLREGRLRVESGPAGLQVWLGEQVLLACDQPALIRKFAFGAREVSFQLETGAPAASLRAGCLPPGVQLSVHWQTSAGQARTAAAHTDASGLAQLPALPSGTVHLAWDAAE